MTQTLNKNKLVAIILCFTMLFSITSGIFTEAFAADEEIVEENVYNVTDGGKIALPHNQKVTLEVDEADSYQWQTYVYAGDTGFWVNIHDANSQRLDISYAMLANALTDRDTAELRCQTGEDEYTGIVEVWVDFSEEATVEVLDNPLQILPFLGEEDENTNGDEGTTPAPDANNNGDEGTTPAPDANENGSEGTIPTPDANENGSEGTTPAPDANENGGEGTTPAPDANTNGEGDTTQTPDANTNGEERKGLSGLLTGAMNKLQQLAAPVLSTSSTTEQTTPQSDANNTPLTVNSSVPESTSPSATTFAVSREASAPTGKYNIVINYVFENGEPAANPWTATIAAGSSYSATIASPDVLGYTPDKPTIEISIEASGSVAGGTMTETVTYSSALVKYEVHHYLQNVSDDKYPETASIIEVKTGYTESMVGSNLAKDEEDEGFEDLAGFYPLLYDETTEIAADGSTVVEIYYDRYYYLMSFDLGGGYGVEPVYAKYGAEIGIPGIPKKAGYRFDGWIAEDGTIYSPLEPFPNDSKNYKLLNEFPYTTMPAENMSFVAKWTAGNTTYDVVFWYENADDNKYSQAGILNDETSVAGSIVDGSAYQNTNFTGRDTTHFTYSHADEDVEIKGDGSTVVNVYFSRNEYTLTFKANVITCSKEVHAHSYTATYTKGSGKNKTTYYIGGCYPDGDANEKTGGATKNNAICGKAEHSHNYNCSGAYGTVKTITAKYQASIKDYFPIIGSNGASYSGYDWEDQGNTYNYVLQTLDVMPGTNVTFDGGFRGTDCVIYYYVEIVEGEDLEGDTTRTFNNKTYKLMKAVEHSFNFITYDEEYHPIEGFTRSKNNASPTFGSYDGNSNRAKLGDSGNGYDHVNYLYYNREKYNLSFSNNGATVNGKGGSVQYEASLNSYNFTPQYPAGLEPDAFIFEGWYTSPFYGDTKVNFTTATMPSNDLTLYARWVPKDHNVKLFPTQADMEAATNQIGTTEAVAHGSTATKPSNPTRGEYIFVGWFYMDGETEKAFDFSMPVNQDLNLYAKWSSKTLMSYTIKYAVENKDSSLTYIAEDTTGSGLAGTTKTFEAKTGDDLLDGYRTGYFPETNSHSLTIDIDDPTKNVFTFIYVPKAELPYEVWYLEDDGNHKYDGEETVLQAALKETTRDAVVTENFVPITGYMPDAYQKRLVLSADEKQNVIIFWYVKDEEHAPVQIFHYIQNAEGDGYTVYQESTDLNGVIGNDYSTNVLEITGYNYNRAKVNGENTIAVEGKVSGVVGESGLLVELYYNREMHPYEFKFLKQGTKDFEVAESVKGQARYGSQVTHTAPDSIGDYELVTTPAAQAINIQIESSEEAIKNVRTFYYAEKEVTIKYKAVGPDGSGTVSPESETVQILSGTAGGSTAKADSDGGYKFVGWYDNVNCAGTPISTGAHFAPDKVNGKHVAKTYYAKFEEDEVTINYEAVGAGGTVDPASEKIKTITGDANGSTATLTNIDDYRFIGWFKDERCTQPVDASLVDKNNKFVPAKVDNKNVAATYYAKFEPLIHITIQKTVDYPYDDNNTFVFKVKGQNTGIEVDVTVGANDSVTVKSLPQDTYTVTEVNSGWRYTAAAARSTNKTETLTFYNTTKNNKWLGWTETVNNFFENFN